MGGAHVQGVTVPDLVGSPVQDAVSAGHTAGVVVTGRDLDGPPLAALTRPGRWLVASQDPVAGSQVERGWLVVVTFRHPRGDEPGVRQPLLPPPNAPRVSATADADDV